MIKGIVGYKVKNYKGLEPILMKLRSHAMQYPGFLSAESLVSEVDSSAVVMMSTWETIENWKIWVQSRITQDLLRQAEAFLKDKPRITAYRIVSTVDWR
ncbi:MAG: antibiotic biosynthesis monooxygenase [Dehalococcoidia bacterium]|nr:antibiotic biosynthesis monooxygenase [Dehalococcoidia bacterium]